jgi:tripartite-type tricarboxylate transporter receptor subunit TctC
MTKRFDFASSGLLNNAQRQVCAARPRDRRGASAREKIMPTLSKFVRFVAAAALAALAFAPAPASAQQWPQRAVKFILPLGPGSGVDISARMFAEKLSAQWGQPVVVENRPGGDGIIAIQAFLTANDDHTILFAPASSFTAHPFQHEKLPYQPSDLVPIARVSNTIVVTAVPASSPISSVKDLMERVKAEPGKLNFNTATGVTDYLFDGYFKNAGLSMTRVPYRDTVQALNDLGEGRIQMWSGALAIARPHVQSGRVRLIATTNSQRSPGLPDLPTIAEAGYPDLTFDGLVGVFGVGDATGKFKDKIAGDVQAAAKDPAIATRLTATGQIVSPGGGADLAASIEAQRQSVAAMAKTLGPRTTQ